MVAPLSKAGGDFAARLGKIGKAVQTSRKDTLTAMGTAAKREHADTIRADTGDSRLSGVGKRGAKVGARFDLVGGDRVEVKATGPLHFVANPMSPHRIPKSRARGRRRYAVIPGVGVRAWANHPGTSGKNTWKRGVPAARKKVTKVADDRVADTIRKAFS